MGSERKLADEIAMADAGTAAPTSKWAEDRQAEAGKPPMPGEVEAVNDVLIEEVAASCAAAERSGEVLTVFYERLFPAFREHVEKARSQERQRVRESLKEQADEYRREANEAGERGEPGGKEKLLAGAQVVECVTEIISSPGAALDSLEDGDE